MYYALVKIFFVGQINFFIIIHIYVSESHTQILNQMKIQQTKSSSYIDSSFIQHHNNIITSNVPELIVFSNYEFYSL